MLKTKKPELQVTRSADLATNTITLRNFVAGDTWNIYRFNDKIGEMTSIVSSHDSASYVDSGLDSKKNYTYLVSLNNYPEELSLNIIADNPNATPPYIEFTPKTGVTVTATSYNKTFPWSGNVVSVLTYNLNGMRVEADLSNPVIKFGKNQIL